MGMRKCESASLFAAAFGLFVGFSDVQAQELDVTRIPHQGQGAEFYFGPDGKTLIGNAKLEGDETHYVYTMRIADGEMVKINGKGEDACSHFFPDGKRLIWTSTRDLTELPKGNYSDPNDYPKGAELYSSALDGSDVKRLTNNQYYDAEVAISPDGKWILWSRQIDGEIDLWRMPADGSCEEQQITFTKGEQEGGAFYLPDSETVLFRSWDISSQGQRGMPMTIYTINQDGSGKKQITTEEGTNWAPFPAPDGEHFAYVKVLPPHNFEIYLRSLVTGEEIRLTHNEKFDGFPSISADGKWMTFSSGRQAEEGKRELHQYIMDLSSLNLGAK
jgi:Tol biopolymer transport system component